MRIGTRGSALALAQARWVAQRLGPQCELVEIAATGDEGARGGAASRARAGAGGDKSRWVSALEDALLRGEIDVAVHSAKDVPTELPQGLALVAIPPRAPAGDVICGAESLEALAAGARVGTSSLRRRAQVRARRPDLEVVELRGNVDTRLRKLADGECDALVLARAGLERLQREAEIGGELTELVPAAGQGALALEARAGALPGDLLAPVSDGPATACVGAERAVVHALGASCNTPVGAHAALGADGNLELRAWLGLPDGSVWLEDRQVGPASEVGGLVARRLLATGAEDLLRRAELMVARAGA
jgi:hydroxymethylbilane synthase